MEVEPGISDVPSLAMEITVRVPENILRNTIQIQKEITVGVPADILRCEIDLIRTTQL